MYKVTPFHLNICAYLGLLITTIIGKSMGYFSPDTAFTLVALSIAIPTINYLVSLLTPQQKTVRIQDSLLLIIIDAIAACIVAILIGEYNIITLLFLLLITSYACFTCNIRSMLIGLLTYVCFLTFVSTIAQTNYIIIQPPADLIITNIICLGFYLVVCAQYFYQKNYEKEKLKQTITQLEKQHQHISQELVKYISPQVWESIFGHKKHIQLETTRKKLTIFFSDIKDFTQMSEDLEAEALTELLNQYLTEMSNIAQAYGGTIDKFIGDSIMIVFGDVNSLGVKHDAVAAVSMALAMKTHMKAVRNHWYAKGITTSPQLRMGINTGFCTVGNFGAESRMEYTVIGREVNLASRLENAADIGEILISEETYTLTKDIILYQDKGEIAVKGFTKPIQTYAALGTHQELKTKSHYIEYEAKGFSMYLDSTNIDLEEKRRILSILEKAANRVKNSL